MYSQASVTVSEISQVGEARRQVQKLATNAGLKDEEAGKTSIVATELATNLVRYSSGGEILMRLHTDVQDCYVELLAIDRGPGMTNVDRCIEDGFSSGGTAGNGLGAVRRLAHEFDIYSTAPGGTVVLARIHRVPPTKPGATVTWGAINRPAPHEVLCGDTWRIAHHGHLLTIMIADGLGHGPQAAEASDVAGQLFDENSTTSPVEFLNAADRRMRGTRGAAVAFAQVDLSARQLRYAGIGNIFGSLRSLGGPTGRGLVSHGGMVGALMRRVQQFDYDCPEDSVLIMSSDGLQTRWSLEKYPGLLRRHPAVVAAVLYRDYVRGSDDVTVCVARCFTDSAA